MTRTIPEGGDAAMRDAAARTAHEAGDGVIRDAANRTARAAEDTVMREAVTRMVGAAGAAVRERGEFHCAFVLQGYGPALCDAILDAAELIPWERTRLYVGYDRHVLPEHPDSLYRQAWLGLFSKLPLRPGRTIRYATEVNDPAFVTRYFEQMTRRYQRSDDPGLPRFDMVLMEPAVAGPATGPGADGGDPEPAGTLCMASSPPDGGPTVYSLTPAAIRAARSVFVLTKGPSAATEGRHHVATELQPPGGHMSESGQTSGSGQAAKSGPAAENGPVAAKK